MFITIEFLSGGAVDRKVTVYVPKDGAVYVGELDVIIRMGKANEPGTGNGDTQQSRCA